MMFLTATRPEPVNDPIALALVLGIILIFVIMVIRKNILSKKQVVTEAPAQEAAPAPTAPGSAGQIKLHDVEPKTAAMLMAIVADKMGKPINELRFISIKEVK